MGLCRFSTIQNQYKFSKISYPRLYHLIIMAPNSSASDCIVRIANGEIPLIGNTIAHYQAIEELGQGGTSTLILIDE